MHFRRIFRSEKCIFPETTFLERRRRRGAVLSSKKKEKKHFAFEFCQNVQLFAKR
jgi:hypothetical protein